MHSDLNQVASVLNVKMPPPLVAVNYCVQAHAVSACDTPYKAEVIPILIFVWARHGRKLSECCVMVALWHESKTLVEPTWAGLYVCHTDTAMGRNKLNKSRLPSSTTINLFIAVAVGNFLDETVGENQMKRCWPTVGGPHVQTRRWLSTLCPRRWQFGVIAAWMGP
eukprot:1935687-Amphidinium_carterae.1